MTGVPPRYDSSSQLRDLLSAETAHYRRDVVPLESLQKLLTDHSVGSHLESRGVPVSAEIRGKIVDKGLRLFAILILLKCEEAVNSIFQHLDDDVLPLEKTDIGNMIPEAARIVDRQEFLNHQHYFFPVLTCEYPPQQYPRSSKLPFTQKSKELMHGSYGEVFKVKIATGHLKGHPPVGQLASTCSVKADQLATGRRYTLDGIEENSKPRASKLERCSEGSQNIESSTAQ